LHTGNIDHHLVMRDSGVYDEVDDKRRKKKGILSRSTFVGPHGILLGCNETLYQIVMNAN